MKSIFKNKLLLVLILLFCLSPAFAVDSKDFIHATPTSDFIDNGDGTVTHKITGLIWMRCSMGQTWTGSTCSGNATKYKWDEAMALEGDWRLPNIDELLSIVEKGSKTGSGLTFDTQTKTGSGLTFDTQKKNFPFPSPAVSCFSLRASSSTAGN